jgi:hypothetical protein
MVPHKHQCMPALHCVSAGVVHCQTLVMKLAVVLTSVLSMHTYSSCCQRLQSQRLRLQAEVWKYKDSAEAQNVLFERISKTTHAGCAEQLVGRHCNSIAPAIHRQ